MKTARRPEALGRVLSERPAGTAAAPDAGCRRQAGRAALLQAFRNSSPCSCEYLQAARVRDSQGMCQQDQRASPTLGQSSSVHSEHSIAQTITLPTAPPLSRTAPSLGACTHLSMYLMNRSHSMPLQQGAHMDQRRGRQLELPKLRSLPPAGVLQHPTTPAHTPGPRTAPPQGCQATLPWPQAVGSTR